MHYPPVVGNTDRGPPRSGHLLPCRCPALPSSDTQGRCYRLGNGLDGGSAAEMTKRPSGPGCRPAIRHRRSLAGHRAASNPASPERAARRDPGGPQNKSIVKDRRHRTVAASTATCRGEFPSAAEFRSMNSIRSQGQAFRGKSFYLSGGYPRISSMVGDCDCIVPVRYRCHGHVASRRRTLAQHSGVATRRPDRCPAAIGCGKACRVGP